MKAKTYKVCDALDGGFGVVSIEGEPEDIIILRVISKWPGTSDESCAVRLSKKHAVAIGRELVKLSGEKTSSEVMAWCADKLEKLEKLIEDDLATVRAVRHALSEDNPRLAKAKGD